MQITVSVKLVVKVNLKTRIHLERNSTKVYKVFFLLNCDMFCNTFCGIFQHYEDSQFYIIKCVVGQLAVGQSCKKL